MHRCFEQDVRAYNNGKAFACDGSKYANVRDGLKGMEFVEAAVKSSSNGASWVDL